MRKTVIISFFVCAICSISLTTYAANKQHIGIAQDSTALPANLKEPYPAGVHTFSMLSARDSMLAYPDSEKSPRIQVATTISAAKSNDVGSQWLNQQIKNIAGMDSTISIAQGIKNRQQMIIKDYQKEAKEDKKENLHLSYYHHDYLKIGIAYNAHDVITLEKDKDEFYGGPHAHVTHTYYTFDVKNKKRLKLYDIITADSLRLQDLIEKNFRKLYDLPPTGSLNTILLPYVHHLQPTENFYFSQTGFNFYYQWEAVAPYREGPIDVSIPYTEVEEYLNPAWKKRMNLK